MISRQGHVIEDVKYHWPAWWSRGKSHDVACDAHGVRWLIKFIQSVGEIDSYNLHYLRQKGVVVVVVIVYGVCLVFCLWLNLVNSAT